jgi:predicted nucleic acid-binding Zn ribbon protein
MERLSDLLPRTAREYGLEDQLDQANAAAAWDRIVSARVPAATGACRLVSLDRGVAIIEADLPIVAQEIRLRSPELLAALRSSFGKPIAQLQLTVRHV